jgi:hypothetical protein
MNGYSGNRWLVALLIVLAVAITAGVAYNIGVSQGVAQVGAQGTPPPPYAYGWHRPWGFGFFIPFAFIFFWAMVARVFWWRPWGYWYHYGPPPHMRDRFDEWHRQAHDRMSGAPDPGMRPDRQA